MNLLTRLCYYDIRCPDGINYQIKDHRTTKPEICNCDNCFYGRTELAEQQLELLEALQELWAHTKLSNRDAAEGNYHAESVFGKVELTINKATGN